MPADENHLSDQMFPEEAYRTVPCEGCGRLVIAGRRVIVETVQGALKHVHFVGDVVVLQR